MFNFMIQLLDLYYKINLKQNLYHLCQFIKFIFIIVIIIIIIIIYCYLSNH